MIRESEMVDAALSSRGKRNTAALRKASARRGASALIFSVCTRAHARDGDSGLAHECMRARCSRTVHSASARARLFTRSRDRPCQLAFSDNFHPPKGPSRPLAPLLFHLSLFLSACTFTIVRSNCAARPRHRSRKTTILHEASPVLRSLVIKSRAIASCAQCTRSNEQLFSP